MTTQPEDRRHVAVNIDVPLLTHLLNLPDDVRIHSVIPRADPPGLRVVLESERFDPVDWNAECPWGASIYTESVEIEGKQFVRFTTNL